MLYPAHFCAVIGSEKPIFYGLTDPVGCEKFLITFSSIANSNEGP